MAGEGKERRRSPRWAVELRVEFRHLGRPNETYADLSRNLSQGGVFLDTSVVLPLGTEVDLEVSPGPGSRPINLRAEIVRVEEEPVTTGSRITARVRGMALKFKDVDSKEIARLMSLARHLSSEARDANPAKPPRN